MFKDLKTDEEKFSYCLGLDVASRIMAVPIKLDKELFLNAIRKAMNNEKPDIDQKEFDECMTKLYKTLDELKHKREVENSDAKLAGDAFRAENAKKAGVTTTPTGLQIEVLREGKGKSPKPSDKVKVHYEGSLISGKVFDSSYKRDKPIVFPLDQVILGWTEGLQHAKVGSKIRLVIPPILAYGKHGAGSEIPPGSTLIFTIELLDIL